MLRPIALLVLVSFSLVSCNGFSQRDMTEAALGAGLSPEALVQVGDSALGVLIAGDSISLIAVHPGSDGYAATDLSTSSPVRRGEVSVRLSFGPPSSGVTDCCAYAYGTAPPGVARVELNGFPTTFGGDVSDGLWLIAVPGVSDIDPPDLSWSFVGAKGETIIQGTGLRFPPDDPVARSRPTAER